MKGHQIYLVHPSLLGADLYNVDFNCRYNVSIVTFQKTCIMGCYWLINCQHLCYILTNFHQSSYSSVIAGAQSNILHDSKLPLHIVRATSITDPLTSIQRPRSKYLAPELSKPPFRQREASALPLTPAQPRRCGSTTLPLVLTNAVSDETQLLWYLPSVMLRRVAAL